MDQGWPLLLWNVIRRIRLTHRLYSILPASCPSEIHSSCILYDHHTNPFCFLLWSFARINYASHFTRILCFSSSLRSTSIAYIHSCYCIFLNAVKIDGKSGSFWLSLAWRWRPFPAYWNKSGKSRCFNKWSQKIKKLTQEQKRYKIW